MTPASLRAGLARVAAHPVMFLLAINCACAGLGVVQFAYALSVLKPADFAVIGVLAATGGLVTGLLDVKLPDLTTKLYFAVPSDQPERRARLLSASLALHLAAGVMIGGLVLAVGSALAPRFLQQAPEWWWVAAMALRMAVGFPVNASGVFLRLVGDYPASGWLRLTTQVAVTVATVAALAASPDLGGYFAAAASAAVASFVLALAWMAVRVERQLGTSLLWSASAADFRCYLAAGRFLAGGSLSGLAKLVGRSGDTLLVAALAGDMTTGLYRVARQGYDSLAGLADAVHQFYTPTIVDCASRERWADLAKHRRRLTLIGAAAATGAIVASWLLLRPLAAVHYPHYLPALPAFEVLAGLLVVTIGVHGWLWPMLVAGGGVARLGALGLLGAFVQLAAIAGLAAAGWLDATTAAGAAWLMAAISYGPLLFRSRSDGRG